MQKTALESRAVFEHRKREGILVELSLVLTSGLGLLLTLQAGADIVLALLNFSDNALLGAATLKATQSGLQRLVFLNANFRHCFPSLRWHPANSWMRSGLDFIKLEYYTRKLAKCQAIFRPKYKKVLDLLSLRAPQARDNDKGRDIVPPLQYYFTIRLTSLFLTTMVLTTLPPCFSRKAAIFSLASTLATTVSLSRSAAISTVPRILPLT